MGLVEQLELTDAERAWTLDMHRRLGPWVRVVGAVTALFIGLSIPFDRPLGFACLGALVVLVAFFELVLMPLKRVEYNPPWLALVISAIAGAVVFGGLVDDGGLGLIVVPLLGGVVGTARKPGFFLAAFSVAILGAVALAMPDTVTSHPFAFLLPSCLIFGCSIPAAACQKSSFENREAALVDPLTSMLNRGALKQRQVELQHQSTLSGETISLIACDLDHFKAINDERGHAAGDAVLTEVAYRLRKALRGFDSVYRLGGEEFLVVLPGSTLPEAMVVADRLAESIRDTPIAGLTVTASFGVAATSPIGPIGFDLALEHADGALYTAKKNGRNRTCSTETPLPLAAVGGVAS